MVDTLSPLGVETDMAEPSPLRVLHLVGSPETDFYSELSKLYAREVITPEGVSATYAIVEPDGSWHLTDSLDAPGPALNFRAAMAALPSVDLVVPHLFCPRGMTEFRDLFEVRLGLPLVGSTGDVCAVATDKAATKAVLESAGLHTPDSVTVLDGDPVPSLDMPVIVKPNSEDNSVGVSLVREPSGLGDAIQSALAHDSHVLVEAFIPGREIRLCVVEGKDGPFVPAIMEYPLDPKCPIRQVDDKLDVGSDGLPVSQARKHSAHAVCPAPLSDDLKARLEAAALRAHAALGARHYSLFDLRVREGNAAIYFLEAGLFWAFSEISMISRMLAADGRDVPGAIGELWRSAAMVKA